MAISVFAAIEKKNQAAGPPELHSVPGLISTTPLRMSTAPLRMSTTLLRMFNSNEFAAQWNCAAQPLDAKWPCNTTLLVLPRLRL